MSDHGISNFSSFSVVNLVAVVVEVGLSLDLSDVDVDSSLLSLAPFTEADSTSLLPPAINDTCVGYLR